MKSPRGADWSDINHDKIIQYFFTVFHLATFFSKIVSAGSNEQNEMQFGAKRIYFVSFFE